MVAVQHLHGLLILVSSKSNRVACTIPADAIQEFGRETYGLCKVMLCRRYAQCKPFVALLMVEVDRTGETKERRHGASPGLASSHRAISTGLSIRETPICFRDQRVQEAVDQSDPFHLSPPY